MRGTTANTIMKKKNETNKTNGLTMLVVFSFKIFSFVTFFDACFVCGGECSNQQEGASCWILKYSPAFSDFTSNVPPFDPNSGSFFQTLQSCCSSPASPLYFIPVSEHWDYHPHPHPHPVEFENLPETNFTELQSVQTLHPPCHNVRYEPENLIDPNLAAHPHMLQQTVSLSCGQTSWACL